MDEAHEYHKESGFTYNVRKFSELKNSEVIKFFYINENEKLIINLENEIKEKFGDRINLTLSLPICLEIMNKGISKGYAAEIPRMLVPGKYTFEWKNKGLFTDYYVAKMTSLGERFLKDFKAKAEKDGFQIEYKLMYSGVEHTFGEKIFKKKNSAGYVYTPTFQVFYRL